ncbi:MarR family winged helix-turn-helix transcriptional regulator [Ensifer adhaerens]|uniref:MarR family winged helix-turn-helix transcriptional regulator n=1 Tax=Ensifer adhaerens TaxID=106592 RepID=UPI000CF1AF6B|nr:MarR family transcriptional regulator [Ensifer adhaerens]
MADTDNIDDDKLALDSFLCFAVYSANHAFTRIYKPLLESLDLTYPQYLVMVLLWEKDDQTVGGLGERLFLESSTLTPLLKRLEAAGYIARVRDKADERQVRVQLTDMGKALRRKAISVPRDLTEATKLGSEDLERLRAEISALRDTLLK